jgi:hypothetical protein
MQAATIYAYYKVLKRHLNITQEMNSQKGLLDGESKNIIRCQEGELLIIHVEGHVSAYGEFSLRRDVF